MVDLFKKEGIQAEPSGIDLFKAAQIEPPSIVERNSNALNSSVRLENEDFFFGEDQGQIQFSESKRFLQKETKDQRDGFKELAKKRFGAEQVKEWEDNPIGFFEATKFTEIEDVVPLGGFKQAADTFGILNIAKKMEKGETLSANEEETMNAFIDKTVEMRVRGFKLGGGINYYGSQMPAFMLEFALTGGVGKLAQKGTLEVTQGLVEKAAITTATAKAANVAAKSTALTANIMARTAVMPQRYTAGYAERRLNDFMSVTDKGEIIFKESEESPAISALKAFGYHSAEVASEISGAAIGKYVINPITKQLKTPLAYGVSKLPTELKQALYQAYKTIQPNATVSKAFSRMGWHGMLEELGEERVADILRETMNMTLEDGYTFDQVLDGVIPSKDQLMLEASLISIMGGAKASADIGFNYLRDKGLTTKEAKEIIDNLSAIEQDALADTATPLPQSTTPSSSEPVLDAQIQSLNLQDPPPINNEESTFSRFYRDFVNTLQPIEDLAKEAQRRMDEGFDGQDPLQRLNKDFKLIRERRVSLLDFLEQEAERRVKAGSKAGQFQKDDPDRALARIIDEDTASLPDIVKEALAKETALDQETGEQLNALTDSIRGTHIFQLREFRADNIDKIKRPKIKTGENPFTLSRTYAGIIGNIQSNLFYTTSKLDKETGTFIETGKGFKPIIDDFDNSVSHVEPSQKKREKDFNDYLIARRILEDLEDRIDVEVSEADIEQSTNTVLELANKYGGEFSWFSEYAQELYDYQKRILHNLVDSGVMSQEDFDTIVEANPNYVPFQRILEESKYQEAVTSQGMFTDANAKKVIKKIQGSDKDIKNTLQSIIANTARIIDISWRNRVAKGVADLAPVMPENIQKVPPTIVKRGETEVIVSYDAGLRRKLEKAIEFFGNRLERAKHIRGKGFIRGQYSSEEKAVRTRIGSTEGTLAHEVGHMIDFEIGLVEQMLNDRAIKKELQQLGKMRLNAETVLTKEGEKLVFEDRLMDVGSQEYIDYITNDREIIANMFETFVTSPETLEEVAPKSKKKFEQIINANPELQFLKQIKPTVERAEEKITKEVWGPTDFPPADTITVYRDGNKEYYKASDPLLSAMRNLRPAQLNATVRFLTSPFTIPASVLRAGATLVPEFWVRNVIRDQYVAFLQSPVRPTPIDMVYGLTSVIGKGELWQEWMKSGGSFNSYMELDDKGLEKAYKELFRPRGKLAKYLMNPLHILADVSFALEQGTRVGAFRKAQKEGIKGIEAALLTREATLDFSRGGSVGKMLNKGIPFLNAGIQGTDKMIRTLKENPAPVIFWGIATITLPQIMLTGYYLYAAPEEDRQEYLEIPQWQRDLFFIFKKDGEWHRTPKPFSWGFGFGSTIERFMIWAYKGDKPEVQDFWKELVMGMGGAISPVYDASAVIPPLMKVAIEDITNYNFFLGREIYPSWMDGKRIESEKARKTTSESAKFLGEQLEMSPAKIDNIVRGIFATSGTYVLNAGDFVLNKTKEWNGEKVPKDPVRLNQSDIPIIRTLVSPMTRAFGVRQPTGKSTNSYSQFYEKWEEIAAIHGSYISKEGKERKDFLQKYEVELRAYKPMQKFWKRTQKIGKISERIYDDTRMDGKTKTKKLNDNGEKILKIVKQANEWHKKNVEGRKDK